MIPRSAFKKYALILLLIAALAQLAATSLANLVRSYPPKSRQKTEPSPSMLFTFYDKYVSPVDGERCRMSPSCSVYSRNAIREKGYLEGLLMTFDRLMRCGNDLNTYPRVYEGYFERFWDPVICKDKASNEARY